MADAFPLDVAIIGAGAAGLATAIFAARNRPHDRIAVLDGARVIGAKILVSGGGRCNVTNRHVVEADFNGGSRRIVHRILQSFSAPKAVAFFAEMGVRLHEEEHGKLFPDSGRARTVLEALVDECRSRGVRILAGHRVSAIQTEGSEFAVSTSAGPLRARRLVLATGGLSLPKTGSDGYGYLLAQRLGHTLVPTTPGLVPLTLQGGPSMPHARLSGVSQPVELVLLPENGGRMRVHGSMLWTHFGVSGPAVLDMSRHWLRAALDGRPPTLAANLLPGVDFAAADAWLIDTARERPRARPATTLSSRLPATVAAAVCETAGLDSDVPLGRLTRDERRRLAHCLTSCPLPVRDSRGYNYAEVTAGGVTLTEVDPRTLQSRTCPGLFLVGEILDVDGRLGGFNFQWAWSSAHVAAAGLAATLA